MDLQLSMNSRMADEVNRDEGGSDLVEGEV